MPAWDSVPVAPEHPFTVGYAGRLVASKGLADLLAAVRRLDAPVEMLLIGNGELGTGSTGRRSPAPGCASWTG